MSLESIYEAVLNGDAQAASSETEAALAASTPAEDILQQACIPAMGEVGRLFDEKKAGRTKSGLELPK